MDLHNSATKANTSERPETEAGDEYQSSPPPAPQSQLIYYTNGSLSHHHQPPPGTAILKYRECLRNHAATIGGHALDGCRDFIATLTASSADPSSIKCAACGCHRNFHRREEYRPFSVTSTHFSRRPRRFWSSRSTSSSQSPSPPRKALEFLSSAVHPIGVRMDDGNNRNEALHVDDLADAANKRISGHGDEENSSSKKSKRSRTKFTQDQKEKMQVFAESLGWKMQKSDGRSVEEFCNEVVGVSKHVFKVWMHNNKNTFAKKDNNDNANENGGFLPPADDHHGSPQDSPEKTADD